MVGLQLGHFDKHLIELLVALLNVSGEHIILLP
jgi:hypothetical protein